MLAWSPRYVAMADVFELQLADLRHRSFGDDVRALTERYIAPHQAPKPAVAETAPPPQRIAPSKLRHAAATLFGREQELARLDDAWDDDGTHVVTLVAWGGVGKTSLVARWAAGLAGRDYDGAAYFDWSFYSQGTREAGGASADVFVAAALKFFGDPAMAESAASPWDKGARQRGTRAPKPWPPTRRGWRRAATWQRLLAFFADPAAAGKTSP